ncbi:DNA primase [Armadillidium vulgare iridescent virus]|uniref:D5 family NTPase involved in DNA replication n=1 Tax=Armadillidium vulgare iridescent virus TaxID=72201 RepID=A0A068QL45_9VIRU|nr:DNA primase [Armadillidium vulgare iridescent virus]CCV02475.1 D5 family NTPase involved in DNA replication [Armadillidium vulgare iridescent virus]
MGSIYEILQSSKNGEYTHVSMGDKRGTWYLTSGATEKFFSEYSNTFETEKICLAEKPGAFVPLLIDVDIKKEIEGVSEYGPNDKLYSDEDVKKLIEVFQNTISENVCREGKNKFTKRHLWSILLEKPLSNESDQRRTKIKNGFHLHFPHIFFSQRDIKNILMPAVKDRIDRLGIFSSVTENPSSLIDEVTSKCWLMYGSSKGGGNNPYSITKIFNHKLEHVTAYKCFEKEKCLDGSVITETNVQNQLPMLLSIIPKPEIISRKIFGLKTPFSIPTPELFIERKGERTEDDREYTEKDIEKMRHLVSLLSKDRADDYGQWWTVGVTLYNIGVSGNCEEEALQAWKDFSELSEKYDESVCDLKWAEMSRKNKPITRTLGSLIFMARKDNPFKTKQYLSSEQIGIKLDKNGRITGVSAIEGFDPKKIQIPATDTEIAEVFLKQHEGSYIHGNNGWFKFNGIIWENLEAIGRHLCHNLVDLSRNYKKLIPLLNSVIHPKEEEDEGYEASLSGDGDDEGVEKNKALAKIAMSKLKAIESLTRKCENCGPQRSVMNTIENMVGEDKLNQKMDQEPRLIAFKNGVFDFGKSRMIFRQGLPEDYLSKQMNVCYNEELHMNHPKVLKMMNFFEKLFPDKELREYFFMQICELYIGGNADKIAMIWTGSGHNGKSVLQHIFEKMLGRLAVKLPKGILVGESPKAGACFPELTRPQGGVRWAVIDEFAPDETINAGMVKYLTGDDSLYARDVHQKGKDVIEFDPFFKLILICNTIPNIRQPDTATWNRIKVIPFETTFVSSDVYEKIPDSEKTKGTVAIKDTEIGSKENLLEIGEALAWYLVQTFIEKDKKRKPGFELPTPFKVIEAGELYRAQGDAIIDFIKDKFEKAEKGFVHIPSMYQEFKRWFPETHSNKNVNMDKKKFISMFLSFAKDTGLEFDSKEQKCFGLIYKIEEDDYEDKVVPDF